MPRMLTNEEVVENIQAVSKLLDGKTPSIPGWNRVAEEAPFRVFSHMTIIRRFGTWNAAMEAAGLTPNYGGRPLKEIERLHTSDPSSIQDLWDYATLLDAKIELIARRLGMLNLSAEAEELVTQLIASEAE